MQRNVAHAREISDGKHGFLTIGVLGLGNVVKELSDIFLSFRKVYPTYRLEFIPMTAKETRDQLISKKIDAVVTNQQDMDMLLDCDYKAIMTSSLVAVARNDHPLFSELTDPALSDLKDYGFVIISPSYSPYTYSLTLKVCQDNGFYPKIRVTAESLFGLMMNVAASDHIAITSERDSRGKESLRQIPINNTDTVNTVLGWNRNNLTGALQKLIEFVNGIELATSN